MHKKYMHYDMSKITIENLIKEIRDLSKKVKLNTLTEE